MRETTSKKKLYQNTGVEENTSTAAKFILPIVGVVVVTALIGIFFSLPSLLSSFTSIQNDTKENTALASIITDESNPNTNLSTTTANTTDKNIVTSSNGYITGPILIPVPEQVQQPDTAIQQSVETPQPPQQTVPTPAPTPTPTAPAAPTSDGNTSGDFYPYPGVAPIVGFNNVACVSNGTSSIDFSSASSNGVIGIYTASGGKLKAQVINGGATYNYPISGNVVNMIPCNMGNGNYVVRIMLNTSGNRYAEIFRAEAGVSLAAETVPYTQPNIFVNYNNNSAVANKARELAAGCANQGDITRNIYRWLSNNIKYDTGKAARAASLLDYIPNPDATLASRTGICFDYASTAAAMFRTLGIPCKVMTGYISPGNLYHSWNMLYINGKWVAVDVSVNPFQWSRIDTTLAASGSSASSYSDKFTY